MTCTKLPSFYIPRLRIGRRRAQLRVHLGCLPNARGLRKPPTSRLALSSRNLLLCLSRPQADTSESHLKKSTTDLQDPSCNSTFVGGYGYGLCPIFGLGEGCPITISVILLTKSEIVDLRSMHRRTPLPGSMIKRPRFMMTKALKPMTFIVAECSVTLLTQLHPTFTCGVDAPTLDEHHGMWNVHVLP